MAKSSLIAMVVRLASYLQAYHPREVDFQLCPFLIDAMTNMKNTWTYTQSYSRVRTDQ